MLIPATFLMPSSTASDNRVGFSTIGKFEVLIPVEKLKPADTDTKQSQETTRSPIIIHFNHDPTNEHVWLYKLGAHGDSSMQG